jgi:hypothetical protein
MALTPAELVKADHEHLIHPLHHPIDNAEPMIYVRGRGATITDATGHDYLDGLAGLWNVNVGHGRAELADAAAAQMKEIAYFSAVPHYPEAVARSQEGDALGLVNWVKGYAGQLDDGPRTVVRQPCAAQSRHALPSWRGPSLQPLARIGSDDDTDDGDCPSTLQESCQDTGERES